MASLLARGLLRRPNASLSAQQLARRALATVTKKEALPKDLYRSPLVEEGAEEHGTKALRRTALRCAAPAAAHDRARAADDLLQSAYQLDPKEHRATVVCRHASRGR
jgi:hypothetical protein